MGILRTTLRLDEVPFIWETSWGFVVAGSGELMRLRAIGEHGPDLARAAARGFEHDVAAVRSPTGTFVAAGVAGDFDELPGGGFHDVDIVIAIGTAPTESEDLSVGRPRGSMT